MTTILHIKNPEPGVMQVNGKLITYKGLAPDDDSEKELTYTEQRAVYDYLLTRHLTELKDSNDINAFD